MDDITNQSLMLDPSLNDVMQAAKGMSKPKHQHKKWSLKVLQHDQNNQCLWCNQVVDLLPSLLIPAESGGTPNSANVIAVCAGCKKTQGNTDPLGWCTSSPALQERRRNALELSLCHPVTESLKDRGTKQKRIRARWDHPRFGVLVWWGWHSIAVVWTAQTNVPPHVLALLRASGGGGVVSAGQWRGLSVPISKADVLKTLVDHNAHLRPIGMKDSMFEMGDTPHWFTPTNGIRAAVKK